MTEHLDTDKFLEKGEKEELDTLTQREEYEIRNILEETYRDNLQDVVRGAYEKLGNFFDRYVYGPIKNNL